VSRDPLLIDAWQPTIPPAQRKKYEKIDFDKWDPCKSLNEAHDRIRKLTYTNNGLRKELLEEKQKNIDTKRELRIVSLLVSPTIAVLLTLGLKYLWAIL